MSKRQSKAAPPPEPRKRGDWLALYRDKIERMNVGDEVKFIALHFGVDLADRDSFRASIASYARRVFGPKKCRCEFNHSAGAVELRRLA